MHYFSIPAEPAHGGAQRGKLWSKNYASLSHNDKKGSRPISSDSTYGTTLYQETGDIYLVADVLGHKDVNTTRKHYAAMKDDHKRKAAKTVKLREL